MAKEKQTIKRLTFTEDEAEQALLAAAEARIAAGDFPAFAELCKTALQAFLQPPTGASQPIMVDTDRVATRLEQIEQRLAALQTGQQTLHTRLEQTTAQAIKPPAPTSDLLERMNQQMDTLQSAQQALSAEMQQIAERITDALANLQPSPVKDFYQPVANPTPSTGDIAVSAATVNRLARFLEDF